MAEVLILMRRGVKERASYKLINLMTSLLCPSLNKK